MKKREAGEEAPTGPFPKDIKVEVLELYIKDEDKECAAAVMSTLLPPIISKKKWKELVGKKGNIVSNFNEVVTVSDMAFLWTVLENYGDTWEQEALWQSKEGDQDQEEEKKLPKFTKGGRSAGKHDGWSNGGIVFYNLRAHHHGMVIKKSDLREDWNAVLQELDFLLDSQWKKQTKKPQNPHPQSQKAEALVFDL